MKRLVLALSMLLLVQLAMGDQLTNILNTIRYGQAVCSKYTPTNSISFAKNHSDYVSNYCSDENYDNTKLQSEFKSLLKQAKKNPNKYGYYAGLAFATGVGTKFNPNKAAKWYKKSWQAGNGEAGVSYVAALTTNSVTGCDRNTDECYKKGESLLKKMDNVYAYEAMTGFGDRCKYAEKAVNHGSLNVYPLYVSCVTNELEKPLTKPMKDKLVDVVNNGETTIGSKKAALQILMLDAKNSNEYKRQYDLLDAVTY